MAESPSHRFGQIVGDLLEAAILPLLQRFAKKHDLHLDRKGPRPCRRGKKCIWVDSNGNKHDLDFVLERGGTPDNVGMPVAFIETAWRRYTKHSRNKAQEIQGAIEPLAETFRASGPFKGAILAGVFTDGAIQQLKSLGFNVLYFPYSSVVSVFRRFGVDASSDENTPDAQFRKKIDAYDRLDESQRLKLAKELVNKHRTSVNAFLKSLALVVSRQIECIIILALHGEHHKAKTVDDAIKFIKGYRDDGSNKPIARYEIEVRYNNGDAIQGNFKDRDAAVDFLKAYQPPSPKTV